MGHIQARIRVANPKEPHRFTELELVVNTGATYTWIKRERLETLGITPQRRRTFRTISGQLIDRDIGEALITCLGETATRIVVFAEKEDFEVVGVDTLEGLGLEVDPITRQLRKVEALLALYIRSALLRGE